MDKRTSLRAAALGCLLLLACSGMALAATYGKLTGSSSGGGGVASVQPGTGISVDTTTPSAPIISATSGFGAHVAISQPDSTNADVTTLDLQNTETNNTHNSVTAAWLMTFPVGGVQIVGDIMSLNSAARGNVTTVSATPTVAFPPRASALRITFGVAATKVVITGLDLATDLGYNFVYWFPASPGAEVDLKLNDTDATATPSIRGNISAASVAADFATNLWLADGTRGAVNGMAQLRDMGSGLAKGYWVNAQDTNFRHDYFGRSTLTANVTSASLAGIPINSTLTITRILPSAY